MGLEGTWPEKQIHLKLAKQFFNTPYDVVAQYWDVWNNKVKPHLNIMEKNFDYENLFPVFSQYPLDMRYVNTSANLSEKKNELGWTVDKPYMTKWARKSFVITQSFQGFVFFVRKIPKI